MTNKITRLCKLIIIPVLVASLTACGTTASTGDKISAVKEKSEKQLVKKIKKVKKVKKIKKECTKIKKVKSRKKKGKIRKRKAKCSKKKKFNFQGDANHPMVKKSGGRLLYSETEINHAKPGKYKIKHIDYDKVYLKKGEKRSKVGIYSNVTKDEKVYWKGEGFLELNQKMKFDDILSKATLNGEPVKLPMKFSDLGKQFSAFDDIDFSVFDYSVHQFYITDAKTGNTLRYVVLPEKKSDPYRGDKNKLLLFLYNERNQKLIDLKVNRERNEIYGFMNILGKHKFKLALDKVGIGDTFNEFYGKIGEPDSLIYGTVHYFSSTNIKGNGLSIDYDNSVYDSKSGKFLDVKNNVVTILQLTSKGEKNGK